jgi:hypothetical protein
MPNGGASADHFAELERFFAPIAPAIVEFAKRHNLLLEKYYHEAPMWSLGFAHPAGGQARLDVARRKDERLSVSATWWVDDYDTFTRSVRTNDAVAVAASEQALVAELEKLLGELLVWRPGAWTQVATGYKSIWGKTWTKAEFEKMAERWPRPK